MSFLLEIAVTRISHGGLIDGGSFEETSSMYIEAQIGVNRRVYGRCMKNHLACCLFSHYKRNFSKIVSIYKTRSEKKLLSVRVYPQRLHDIFWCR